MDSVAEAFVSSDAGEHDPAGAQGAGDGAGGCVVAAGFGVDEAVRFIAELSVDDQVEWLDNSSVLYGLPRRSGSGAASSDVWAVRADGAGTPEVLVRDAWSPAVVRP